MSWNWMAHVCIVSLMVDHSSIFHMNFAMTRWLGQSALQLSPEVHQAHGSSLFRFHARKSPLVSNGTLMFCSTKKPRKVKWRCGCRFMVWSHDSWRIHIGDFWQESVERLSPEIGLGTRDVEPLIDVDFELKTGDPPETKQKELQTFTNKVYIYSSYIYTYRYIHIYIYYRSKQ